MASTLEPAGPGAPRPRVRTLAFKLLFAELRPRLGDEGWADLMADVGGPSDVRQAPLDELVDAAALEAVIARLASAPRDAIAPVVLGRALAQRWAAMYRVLVARLRSRPELVIDLFVQEVHPWLFEDAPRLRVVHLDGRSALVHLPSVPDARFLAGLLEGLLAACDVRTSTVVVDDARLSITWAREAVPTTRRLALWLRASRARTLGATLVAMSVGTALAAASGPFAWAPLALAGAAVVALHVAANLVNDVVDHRRGVDPANLAPTPFSGGSRVLQETTVQPSHLVAAAGVLALVGAALGAALVARAGLWVLGLGFAGAALGYAYSAAPFRLAYRGLGELAVFVVFGPLITMGAYAVQAGAPTLDAALAGIPVGLGMATVVYGNGLPDVPWDARRGKRTLPVRLGRWAVLGLATGVVLVHVALVALVVADVLATTALFALATAPFMALAVRGHARHADQASELVPFQALLALSHVAFGLTLALAVGLEAWS